MGREPTEFAASNGWFQKWRKFYNVSLLKSSEAKSIDLDMVETLMQNSSQTIENCSAEQILNFYETMLSQQSMKLA